MTLKERIEAASVSDLNDPERKREAHKVFSELRFFLNAGDVRAAVPQPGSPAGWVVQEWIRAGILLGIRSGMITETHPHRELQFFDKHTLPIKRLTAEEGIRIVPGGSAVRDGVFLGRGVVIMPPSYVNVGAYIDEATLVDSNVLVGSCAQIGKQVHLSAGVQLGGVLEPPSGWPVIIEDDVFVSDLAGIRGTIVRRRAVIGAGVILNSAVPLYDLVKKTVIRAANGLPLIVPEGAVVVPGSRTLSGPFPAEHGLALQTPVIVKYRDERTNARTALEQALR
ncbi:MAG: 2,3,4,5-tetrahydropyridine-2,6-dicarboxylate N-succinyltransferase [Bacteroidota bacterium]|mgnify:FL=1